MAPLNQKHDVPFEFLEAEQKALHESGVAPSFQFPHALVQQDQTTKERIPKLQRLQQRLMQMIQENYNRATTATTEAEATTYFSEVERLQQKLTQVTRKMAQMKEGKKDKERQVSEMTQQVSNYKGEIAKMEEQKEEQEGNMLQYLRNCSREMAKMKEEMAMEIEKERMRKEDMLVKAQEELERSREAYAKMAQKKDEMTTRMDSDTRTIVTITKPDGTTVCINSEKIAMDFLMHLSHAVPETAISSQIHAEVVQPDPEKSLTKQSRADDEPLSVGNDDTDSVRLFDIFDVRKDVDTQTMVEDATQTYDLGTAGDIELEV